MTRVRLMVAEVTFADGWATGEVFEALTVDGVTRTSHRTIGEPPAPVNPKPPAKRPRKRRARGAPDAG